MKLPIIAFAVASVVGVSQTPAMADEPTQNMDNGTAGAMVQQRHRRAERLDARGDRINARLDRRGDRVEARLDQRAERARLNGNERRANRLERKGDRVDQRLDNCGERIDRRLDRRATRQQHRARHTVRRGR